MGWIDFQPFFVWIKPKGLKMDKLLRFLHDYGTDSVSVLLAEMAMDTNHPDDWNKATAQMAGLLKDALRQFASEHHQEIENAYKMPVDEVKDLMLNHSW